MPKSRSLVGVYGDKHIGKDLLPTVFMLMSLESSGMIEGAGRLPKEGLDTMYS